MFKCAVYTNTADSSSVTLELPQLHLGIVSGMKATGNKLQVMAIHVNSCSDV